MKTYLCHKKLQHQRLQKEVLKLMEVIKGLKVNKYEKQEVECSFPPET